MELLTLIKFVGGAWLVAVLVITVTLLIERMVEKKMIYNRYQLIDYFDVWGNEEDGYEVNNLSREFEVILPYDATIEDVITALICKGYFTPLATKWTVDAWDDGTMIELYQVEDGKPLCRLEWMEEVEQ